MSVLLPIATGLLAWTSALALYAGSGHCRWPRLRLPRRRGSAIGAVLAALALAVAIVDLGVGAGLCAMLGHWMLAMLVLPWLGAWREVAAASPAGPRP
ncbi:hypothetical protein GCM10027359_15600 [Marilutibacter aestuarii]